MLAGSDQSVSVREVTTLSSSTLITLPIWHCLPALHRFGAVCLISSFRQDALILTRTTKVLGAGSKSGPWILEIQVVKYHEPMMSQSSDCCHTLNTGAGIPQDWQRVMLVDSRIQALPV